MPARKHHKKRLRGKGFFDSLKKAATFVKDNGLISKGLNLGSSIASSLGKKDIADRLNTGASYAQAVGAGRKRRKAKTTKTRKLVRYSVSNPTLQSEIMNMDNNNRLFGTGRKRASTHKTSHMKGGNFLDDLMGGISTVARTVLPIAQQVAPMFMGHGKQGSGLKLAGMGLGLAGGAHAQNYSGPRSYHLGHQMPSYRRNDNHMRGSGFLSRVNRSHGKMALV